MPAPYEERDAWEHELRAALPTLLASHQQELAAGTADRTRQEWLEWQIQRVQKRMADLEARLAKIAGKRLP
jgi:exonuclease VII large subunit